MSQKYIAQWAWGHNELWMDMRRYHYTDLDPSGTQQVFPGFAPPTNLYPDNDGKIVAAHPSALQLGVCVELCRRSTPSAD